MSSSVSSFWAKFLASIGLASFPSRACQVSLVTTPLSGRLADACTSHVHLNLDAAQLELSHGSHEPRRSEVQCNTHVRKSSNTEHMHVYVADAVALPEHVGSSKLPWGIAAKPFSWQSWECLHRAMFDKSKTGTTHAGLFCIMPQMTVAWRHTMQDMLCSSRDHSALNATERAKGN